MTDGRAANGSRHYSQDCARMYEPHLGDSGPTGVHVNPPFRCQQDTTGSSRRDGEIGSAAVGSGPSAQSTVALSYCGSAANARR